MNFSPKKKTYTLRGFSALAELDLKKAACDERPDAGVDEGLRLCRWQRPIVQERQTYWLDEMAW